VSVTSADISKIPFEQFLEAQRANGPAGAVQGFALLLLGGDAVQGRPAGYKDERILWENPTLGQLSIALQDCRGLLRAGKLTDALDAPRQDDLVQMSNGDSAVGIFLDITREVVRLDVRGMPAEVPLNGIDFIHFGQAGKPK